MDWDVSQGGIDGLIIETNSTTANGRATITVRYDALSPSADEADTVHIQATDGTTTKTLKRTVFRANLTLNFDQALHEDNALRFPAGTGDTDDTAGFNWTGDDNATRPSAKMEAIAEFSPEGIDWEARGVSFNFRDDPDGEFCLRLQRRKIAQAMRGRAKGVRNIEVNDDVNVAGEWPYDGGQDSADAQYPTAENPDRAFRIDAPGALMGGPRFSYRSDFTEIVEWHDGESWITISIEDEGAWHTNVTALPPDATKGGDNSHGAAHHATAIPNAQPGQVTVPNQTVVEGGVLTLFLSPILRTNNPDSDPDGLHTAEWDQTGGPAVNFEAIGRKLEFTAPEVAEETELTFRVRWKDAPAGLHHHRPTNTESEWSEDFTVTIMPQQEE